MVAKEDRVIGHRLAARYLEAEGERDAIVLVEHYEKGGAHAEGGSLVQGRRRASPGRQRPGSGHQPRRAWGSGWGPRGKPWEPCAPPRRKRISGRANFAVPSWLLSGQQRFFAAHRGSGRSETSSHLSGSRPDSRGSELDRCAVKEPVRPPLAGPRLECLARAAGYLLPGGLYEAADLPLLGDEANSARMEPVIRMRLDRSRGYTPCTQASRPPLASCSNQRLAGSRSPETYAPRSRCNAI